MVCQEIPLFGNDNETTGVLARPGWGWQGCYSWLYNGFYPGIIELIMSSSSMGSPENHTTKSIDQQTESRQVAFGAVLLAGGTLTSRVLGLVREMIMGALFPRFVTDAFIVAYRLPNLFRRLLGEGAIAASFIPVFVETLGKSEERAKKLAGGVYTLLLSISSTLSLLALIYMEPLLKFVASGEEYRNIPGKLEATIHYARILFVFLVLISTYAFFMAILNSFKKFALPALMPALLNICLIVGALLPSGWFPYPGDGLAWSVVVGGLCQVLFLVPSLRHRGFLPKIQWPFGNKDVARVLKTAGPALLGMGILQLTTFFNVQFATRLPEGSVTWLYYADRFLELPLSLFAVSLGSALLPTLSRLHSQNNRDGLGQTASYYLRVITCLAFPSAIYFFCLAEPILSIAFQRGKFGVSDVQNTAEILRIYSLSLITYSLIRVMTPSYYAVKNTWFPALVSGGALILHLILAPVLMEYLGVRGLALSTALTSFLNVTLLMAAFGYFVGHLELRSLGATVFKVALASTAFGFILEGYFPLTTTLFKNSWIGSLFSLGIMSIVGFFAFLFVATHLGVSEVHDAIKPLKRRLARLPLVNKK